MPEPHPAPAPVTLEEPALSPSLETRGLAEALALALKQRVDPEGFRFVDGSASGATGGALSFADCAFQRCSFAEWEPAHVHFTDCLLDHCDLSGLKLDRASFHRVRFQSCRLTGLEWQRSSLTDVTLEGCSADYLMLSQCQLARVRFKDCRMRESLWQDVRFRQVSFERCDLCSVQIRNVPMEGLDMTTCSLDGLQIDPRDLRGMRVTALQALQCCAMLGLSVEE
ncbi:MAG: pentapeptide repeat-containing protein [Clostridiales bacterium]|nr:pentapeptide repeat-containing protein [Clostridiales bacterium]